MTDILIAAALCYFLRKLRTGHRKCVLHFDRIIVLETDVPVELIHLSALSAFMRSTRGHLRGAWILSFAFEVVLTAVIWSQSHQFSDSDPRKLFSALWRALLNGCYSAVQRSTGRFLFHGFILHSWKTYVKIAWPIASYSYWIAAVYAISFLAALNTRKVVRGKGTDQEGDTSGTRNTFFLVTNNGRVPRTTEYTNHTKVSSTVTAKTVYRCLFLSIHRV